MHNDILKNPDRVSFIVLAAITVAAVLYGIIHLKNIPQKGSYPVAANDEFPYQMGKPFSISTLSSDLTEVSGLSYVGNNQLYAIQDENGKVFVYDLNEERVVDEFDFGKDRDYEGVAHIDSTIFVMERDGDLHRIEYQRGQKKQDRVTKIESDFRYENDTEGICYDPVSRRLLIAPKEQQLFQDQKKPHIKSVYGVDQATGKVDPNPVISIDQFQVGEIIYGQRKRYDVKPSGLAVHPQTGHIYVVASVGKLLLVINRLNELIHVERLDMNVFPQPEGIAFTSEGDLIISSEGKGQKGRIVRFKSEF